MNYDKLRADCGAARGWFPWEKWEDGIVRHLVEEPNTLQTVASVAKTLKRTENAVLCRIEKRYGEQMRAHFTAPQIRYADSCLKPPFVIFPNDKILDAMLGVNRMPFSDPDRDIADAATFDAALIAIKHMQRSQYSAELDASRWCYRVTPEEYQAIGREIQRRQDTFGYKGNSDAGTNPRYFASITLAGVRIEPNADSLEVLKDYGTSG